MRPKDHLSSPSRESDRSRADPFSLIVITSPHFFDGEVDCLEGLLQAGLTKLHIRKQGAGLEGVEKLLSRLAVWRERLVLHDSREMADRFGIPQIHCFASDWKAQHAASWKRDLAGDREQHYAEDRKPRLAADSKLHQATDQKLRRPGGKISTSFHCWEEVSEMGAGLEYAFLSPLFDSISKQGYAANPGLLQRPPDAHHCKMIGLGGIDKGTIAQVMENGWDGAALLGCIWEQPGAAVERYTQIQELVNTHSS